MTDSPRTDSSAITRRHFMRAAGAATATAGLAMNPLLARALAGARGGRRVAVLGGGMAGLTVAHELVERGFKVDVYEPVALGGKARSIDVAGTRRAAAASRSPASTASASSPASTTTSRTRCGGSPTARTRTASGTTSSTPPRASRSAPNGRAGRASSSASLYDPTEALTRRGPADTSSSRRSSSRSGFRPHEAAYLVERLLVFLTSCDERRFGQWENVPWWDFIGAESRSEEYQKVVARGLTRSLVAAKETVASTRTIGNMAEAFVMNIMQRGNDGALDRVLDAPTNEAWIKPWVRLLKEPRRALPHGPAGRRAPRDRDGRIRDADRRATRTAGAGASRPTGSSRRCPPSASASCVSPKLLARRPVAGGDPRALHRLDGRDPVLPARAGRHHPRPRHLRRRAVGADRAHPGAVLGRARLPRRLRRRQGGRLPLGRHLRLGHARHPLRQARQAVHARRRSSARSGRRSRPTSRTAASLPARRHPALLVPRPRRQLEPQAAAATRNATPLLVNTVGLVGEAARAHARRSRTCSSPATTCRPTSTWRRWRARTRPAARRWPRCSRRPARRPRRRRCTSSTTRPSSRPSKAVDRELYRQGQPNALDVA